MINIYFGLEFKEKRVKKKKKTGKLKYLYFHMKICNVQLSESVTSFVFKAPSCSLTW